MPVAHRPHPSCPECGRALYKSFEKGFRVSKSEPFRFCRGEGCSLSGPQGLPPEKVKEAEMAPRGNRRRRSIPAADRPKSVTSDASAAAASEPSPPEPKPSEASEDQTKAVREAFHSLSKGKPQKAVVFTLAVALQEAGENLVANLLIEKHGLSEMGLSFRLDASTVGKVLDS